jgi:predicted Zn-dependent peptidase
VQVWVKTGSVHEGEHLGAGLSHYLEHMLFTGTARRARPGVKSAQAIVMFGFWFKVSYC